MSPDVPSPALRARVLEAAAAQRSTPTGIWWRRLMLAASAAGLWLPLLLAIRGVRADWTLLPPVDVLVTFGVLIAAASSATFLGVARGSTMTGPSTETLRMGSLGLPLALAALVLGVDLRAPFSHPLVPSTLSHALNCVLLVSGFALPLLALGFSATRGLTRSRPGFTGACLGLAAATWAHAVVRASCPVVGVAHAAGGHWLPLLPLMMIGALAGIRLDRRLLER